ncbi:hypothetical protein KW842_01905 [Duganella sp. sic0402]|uniref:hypothetical protein n=1 Tax=Duganella sp. sic0402 TaxID=2854786 RepID=UPI001C481282|nr:hypothetical protein [Duganella sp. sic0402]MBV7534511.1 hypothetical protein [Duganella sp. sic0402]
MYTRTDAKMACMVNRGIALDPTKGAATAWAYMKYYAVPQQVILRVLAEPELRRQSAVSEQHGESEAKADGNFIHLWRAPTF